MSDTPQLPTSLDYWSAQPFQSRAEQQAAFSSPRYADPADEAYRQAVAAKLSISSYDGEPRVSYSTGAQATRGTVGHAEIRMTDTDHEVARSLIETQQREATREAAINENERRLAETVTIPDLEHVEDMENVEGFKDEQEMVRFMRARDENGKSLYDRSSKYRTWIARRILASDF